MDCAQTLSQAAGGPWPTGPCKPLGMVLGLGAHAVLELQFPQLPYCHFLL